MIAKYLGIPEKDLCKAKNGGILKNMACRRAFLSDTSHKIRFVYIPKHSSWLNQIEAVFGMINRRVMRGGSFTSKSDRMDKLKRFTTYFNEKIAKPMKWTFTGRPTEKESLEKPKTWRELWPFRRLLSTIEKKRTELKGCGTSALGDDGQPTGAFYRINSVPEPLTLLMLILTVISLDAICRRQRRVSIGQHKQP